MISCTRSGFCAQAASLAATRSFVTLAVAVEARLRAVGIGEVVQRALRRERQAEALRLAVE
jgi:hypothetical protein